MPFIKLSKRRLVSRVFVVVVVGGGGGGCGVRRMVRGKSKVPFWIY